jgi:hypothetical protein
MVATIVPREFIAVFLLRVRAKVSFQVECDDLPPTHSSGGFVEDLER